MFEFYESLSFLQSFEFKLGEVFWPKQVKILCSYLLLSTLYKNVTLLLLTIGKLLFLKHLKGCVKCNTHVQYSFMSINGNNDVIKKPVLPSIDRLINQRKDF